MKNMKAPKSYYYLGLLAVLIIYLVHLGIATVLSLFFTEFPIFLVSSITFLVHMIHATAKNSATLVAIKQKGEK